MADGKVHITMTADEAQAWTAIQKIKGSFDQMGNSAKKAGKKAQSSFQKGIKNAAGMALAVVGVGSAYGIMSLAVRAARREIELLDTRQKAAAGTQFTTAQNLAEVIRTAQASEFKPGEILKMIERLEAKTKIGRGQIVAGLIEPLSGKGSVGKKEFEEAILVSLKNQELTGRDFAPVAGGILDVIKNDPRATPRSALGFTTAFGQATRIPVQAQQLSALIPLLGAGKAAGATPEQSAELAATISQLVGDVEGAQSTTGVLRFLKDITSKKLIPETSRAGFGKETTKFRRVEGKTLDEKLKDIRGFLKTASKESRADFVEKLGGRVRTSGAILQLLDEDPVAIAELKAAQKKIGAPSSKQSLQVQEEFERRARNIPTADIVEITNQGKASAEQIRQNNKNGLSGAVTQSIEDILKEVPGQGALATTFALAQFKLRGGFGTDPAATRRAGAQALEAVRNRFDFGKPFRTQLSNEGTPGATDFIFSDVKGPGAEENPAFNEAINTALQKQIDLLNRKPDKAIPVKIVSDTRPTTPRADAQTEGEE